MNPFNISRILRGFTLTVEKVIITVLILLMSIILISATIELVYHLYNTITSSDHFLLISLNDLMDIFGVFLLILIGIELLETIKIYLKHNVVHVEVVVLVAIIALARKIVILKVEELSSGIMIGIGVLIIALAITYYIIKKTGLMILNSDENPADVINNINLTDLELKVKKEKKRKHKDTQI